jgi:dihydroorotate dehydrogenase (NAD+) catalytic subunit
MLVDSSILYDIHKTFEENFHNPLFTSLSPPVRQWSPKAQWIRCLGFSLASRIGVAACAVTTGKGIALLASLGVDILTYKTIRRRAHPTHPLPNIVYVNCESQLHESDLDKLVYTRQLARDKIAISNSFGNGCLEPEILIQDIAFAKNSLSEGQILIVSVYGEGETLAALATEFAETAFFAQQAGADVIELNLSCPNLLKKREPIYWDAEAVYHITAHVVNRVENVPVIVKLGLLPAIISLSKILVAIARAGASGVSAINSIRMRVVDQSQQPAFGKRIFSGVSGYPIRSLALSFIKKMAQINREQKLNLAILGMGGITSAEHFNEFFDLGADIALSATGLMWNPYLAFQYHQQMQL